MNQKTQEQESYNIEWYGIHFPLIEQVLSLPSGWEKEVYFDKEKNEIQFSSPMTPNTWTRSDKWVGRIEALDFSDLEGWKTIDENFVEVDDGNNETDPDYKGEEYSRFYENSSIIKREEAIDRLIDDADFTGWYEEIVNNIHKITGEE